MTNNTRLNPEVTSFLDNLKHPFRKEIEELRVHLLGAHPGLTENIKWNGPNYLFNGHDRITLKINPPKLLMVILHRGAKVKEQPAETLIKDSTGLLEWKSNDRAVATFRNLADIQERADNLNAIARKWILAAVE